MSAAHSDFQHSSPAGGIWHSLNRFLFTLIVLTLLATMTYRMLPEISKRKEQQARVEKLKKLDTSKIAPMVAFLASDAAHEVTGQIFAVRGNEIFLMSQPRPLRGMHTAEGWTPESIAERVLPSMKPDFTPLANSAAVFSWDPV